MDYDLIVVKTLERVYKNYYYIIRGEYIKLLKNGISLLDLMAMNIIMPEKSKMKGGYF